MAAREGFARLLKAARQDPLVLGVVLSASRALGLATPDSDYDVRLILADDAGDEALARYGERAMAGVDASVMRLADFAAWAAWGSPTAWDRYTFVHAQVLHDPAGVIAPLVAEKGVIPPGARRVWQRGALDALINSVYRALKCHRRGNGLCARIEGVEGVQFALDVLFALEGRVRPYPTYLAFELRHYPLTVAPIAGEELLALCETVAMRGEMAALQRLFAVVAAAAREAGHGDVLASWGDTLTWLETYRPG